MAKKSNNISTGWIHETRDDGRAFINETDFPDPHLFFNCFLNLTDDRVINGGKLMTKAKGAGLLP